MLDNLVNLFIQPPGILIYYIAIIACMVVALIASFKDKLTDQRAVHQRLRAAIWMILVMQLTMLVVSGLAWFAFFEPHSILPPIDRAVIFLSLIWAGWVWLFPRSSKRGDLTAIILTILGIAALVTSYLYWSIEQSSIYFNYSWIDWAWIAVSLLVVLGASIILIFQKPTNWKIGLGFLFISGIGLALHLVSQPIDNDFSPWIRITQVLAFPLIPIAFRRSRSKEPQNVSPLQREILGDSTIEKRRFSSDLKTIQNWMQLSREGSIAARGLEICKATAISMLADQCFLLYKRPMDPEVIIQTGYDLLREQVFPGASLTRGKAPALLQAVYQGNQFALNVSSPVAQDLEDLRKILGVKSAGSLMFQPIFQEEKPWGGLLLYSPYAHREWIDEDQVYLKGLADLVAPFLTNPADDWTTIDFQKKIGELEEKNQVLEERFQEYQSMTNGNDPASQLNEMYAKQQEAEQKIAKLQEENERLVAGQKINPGSSKTGPFSDSELRLALEEVARLQTALQEAQIQIDHLQKNNVQMDRTTSERFSDSFVINADGFLDSDNRKMISSIVQELSQPISAVLGYTELILGESVGGLQENQRQFIEHIKASTILLRSLSDHLLQITSTGGPQRNDFENINVNEIIDQILTDTSAQIREKNITLLLDLPEQFPVVSGNKESLQKILTLLLQNAGGATPSEGVIHLTVSMAEEENQPLLSIKVKDSGGGIADSDLPLVFTGWIQGETTLIKGIGDTKGGLSIAKTVVETNQGQIWVESDKGTGATFYVLLPVDFPLTEVG
ncbi:MAG TPA: ATP-binding protein [Longilinea sp.]|nr:ATP-binding protein [Longilinea sp.]